MWNLLPVCFSPFYFFVSFSDFFFFFFLHCKSVFHEVCWFPFVVFHDVRLAGQTASRAVSLFLDGDVSFLLNNSFPSNIQLLKVCDQTWICVLLNLVRISPLFMPLLPENCDHRNMYCFSKAARRLVDPVSDSLSPHGLRVFVTLQRESHTEQLNCAFIGSLICHCCGCMLTVLCGVV